MASHSFFDMDACSDDVNAFTGPYLEFAIAIPLFLILQLTLLSHSIYHERCNQNQQRISLKLRILFIALQVVGIYWTILDACRLLIDPPTKIFQGSTVCLIMAYSPKIVPAPFYLLYLLQILCRLESSFTGSFLQLSKCTVYTLLSLILIPVIIGPIISFILNRHEHTCIALWNPNDNLFEYSLSFCDIPLEADAVLMYAFVLIWIVVMNIIIGIIFSVKLNQLLSNHADNEQIQFRFKSLIIKNSILTLSGAVSTVVCYLLWLGFIRATFLYLDLFINCVVIALMFKYNEKWYKKLCRCCILMFFIKCDQSKTKVDEEIVMRYVNGEPQLRSVLSMSVNNDTVRHQTELKTMDFDTDS